MKRPALKNYQTRAITYALTYPYSILALDPGLGKSRCAIEVRNKLKNKCLVICPAYLIPNWIRQIALWSDSQKAYCIKSSKDIISSLDKYDYIITSYDLIQKAEHMFDWAEMVVIDEAHAIKSMKAKRTEFIHKNIYENSTKRVMILTGTPIKNRVQEFYSLLALTFYSPDTADSQFLDLYPSEIDFADKFSYRQEYEMDIGYRRIKILKWTGIRNTDELKKWLEGRYIRIRSSEVLDLPPLTYKSIQVSEVDNSDLLEAFNRYAAGNDSVTPDIKAQAALQKVPFTIKYVKDLLEEIPCVLVYSDHVASAEAIAEEFDVQAITGKIAASKRSDMADEFQNGIGNILVCTIGSMKEGKDLYRASHIVFNDYPWVPGDLKQVIYRIQRIGQKSPCTVHKIIGSPQDFYIMDTIESKIKTIEQAT